MANTCSACGLCCKLFLINLSKAEYESGRYQTMFEKGTVPVKSGAYLLAQHPDGSCIYLANNQCSIHADRPAVCRAFFCTTKSKKFSQMVKIIQEVRDQKPNPRPPVAHQS